MTPKDSPLVAVLFRHKRAKLIALALAVVCWRAIRDEISFEVVVPDIRIEPKVRPGMAVQSQSAGAVEVTFRGSQDDVRLIDQKQLRAAIDLTRLDPGIADVTVRPGDIAGATGVRAVQVRPGRIRVVLDREGEKVVPVRGTYVGKPLIGQVESVTCTPAVVRLRGPVRKLENTEFVSAAPVDVDGRIASFRRRSPVYPPGDTWVARIDPPDVQVTVNIADKATEREWPDMPVNPLLPAGARFDVGVAPSNVTVLVYGRTESVDRVPEGSVRVFVDCTGIAAPGEYDLPASVYLPLDEDVETEADPGTVHVTVRAAGAAQGKGDSK